jgi:hypothetical protein
MEGANDRDDTQYRDANRRLDNPLRPLLRVAGYKSSRADANLEPWDIVGIGPTNTVLVHVVTGHWPNALKLNPLCEFHCPPNCTRLVHQWRDDAELPITHIVTDINQYL